MGDTKMMHSGSNAECKVGMGSYFVAMIIHDM